MSENQLDLFSKPKDKPRKRPRPYRFDGVTYDPKKDGERLSNLLDRIYAFMADGQWRTLREISDASGGAEASVSARLRDLRKDRFQRSHPNDGVDKKRRGEGGVWLYRVRVS